jgi:GPI ethanolamine phosphate transferase 1
MNTSPSGLLGGAGRFLLLSLAFHVVFLGSIFDIYFVSPVVRVDRTYGVQEGGLSDRVVLIVGEL